MEFFFGGRPTTQAVDYETEVKAAGRNKGGKGVHPVHFNKGTTAGPNESREPGPSGVEGSVTSFETDWSEPTYVCDYDVNPTVLYQAIEAKEWEYVMAFFGKTDRHYTEREARSAKIQAATWVDRKEASGKPRWRLLPLHAAIIFEGPFKVIKVILETYPKAIKCKDDRDMLPIHLAFKHGRSEAIVQLLTDAYPEAILIKDFKGRTPLECAAISGIPNRGLVIYTTSSVALERKAAAQKVAELASENNLDKLKKEKAELEDSSKKMEKEIEVTRKEIEKLQRELKETVKMESELKDKIEGSIRDLENTKKEQEMEEKEHTQEIAKLKNEVEEIQKGVNAAPVGSKKFFGRGGSPTGLTAKSGTTTKPAATKQAGKPAAPKTTQN